MDNATLLSQNLNLLSSFRSSRFLKATLNLVGTCLGLAGLVFVIWTLESDGEKIDFNQFDATVLAVLFGLSITYAMANGLLAEAFHNWLAQENAKSARRKSWRVFGVSQLAKYIPGNIFHLVGRQAIGGAAGIKQTVLAKTSAFELAGLAISAAVFGIWFLNDAVIAFTDWRISLPEPLIFCLVVLGLFLSTHALVGTRAAIAMANYVGFFFISGLVFCAVVVVLAPTEISSVRWATLAAAFVVAWLVGFLTPGAPAGLGSREFVLLSLLAGQVDSSTIAFAVIIGRVVTILGDVMAYFAVVWLPSKSISSTTSGEDATP